MVFRIAGVKCSGFTTHINLLLFFFLVILLQLNLGKPKKGITRKQEEGERMSKVKNCLKKLGDYLSEKQKEIVGCIIEIIMPVVILTGPAGVGKTRTIKGMCRVLKMMNEKFVITSTTGISALLYEDEGVDAYTVHQALCMDAHSVEIGSFTNRPSIWFSEAKYIIVDEMSMMSSTVWEALMHHKAQWQKIILCGDLTQLPPVVVGLNERSALQTFNRGMYSFVYGEYVACFMLTEKQRQKEDREFAVIQDRIAQKGYFKELNDFFPKDYMYTTGDEEELRKVVGKCVADAENEINTMIIVPTHAKAETYNRIGQYFYKDNPSYTYETEYVEASENTLDKIDHEGNKRAIKQKVEADKKRIRHILGSHTFYVGQKVMITDNETVSMGEKRSYFNGSIGTVLSVCMEYMEIKIWHDEKVVKIYPIETKHYVYLKTEKEIIAYCYGVTKRMPIISAFAVTAHKTQGMSLKNAFIDPQGCFLPGQFYTMISRIETRAGVYLLRKIRPEDVIVDRHAVVFYKYVLEHGRVYTNEMVDFLKQRFYEADRYREAEEYSAPYLECGILDDNDMVEYSFEVPKCKIMRYIISVLSVNRDYAFDRRYVDPRLPYLFCLAINYRDVVIIDLWIKGMLDRYLDPEKKELQLLKLPELAITEEEGQFLVFIEEVKAGIIEDPDMDRHVDEYFETYETNPDEIYFPEEEYER